MSGEVFTIEHHPNRDSWLAGRTVGIGASESPILFGHGWSSEFALYCQKRGEWPAEPENERMLWGSRLEPVIAEEVALRKGWQLTDLGRWTTCRSVEHPHMTATFDRIIAPIDHRGPGVLEIKNTSEHMREEWNDVGAPLRVQIQGQHQLKVSGFTWGCYAVLIGGNDLRIVDFERDDEFIAMLVERCETFIARVREGRPPQVDGSGSTTSALSRLFSRDDGAAIVLPPSAIEWDEAIKLAQADMAKAEEIETLNKNRIREAIGDASFGDLPDRSGRWSWKANKTGTRALKRVTCPAEAKKGRAA